MWPHDFLSASAIVHGEAGWTSGRDLVLLATIEVPPPEEDAAALPPLGGGPQQLIERLGTVASQGLVGAPTDEESAFLDRVRPRAREVVRRAFSAIEGERFVLEIPPFVKFWLRRPMKGIPVPFPQLREAEAPDVRDTPISPKQALMDVFRPRGYEYVTGYGTPRDYCLRKRTQAHGLLSLYFGHGRWSRSLMGTLRYEGPLWHHDVSLRFALRQAEHQHYFIFADQEMLQKVVANAGAVVDYLEQTFVPALDEIHGPAPAWWVYSSDQPVSGATASDAQ